MCLVIGIMEKNKLPILGLDTIQSNGLTPALAIHTIYLNFLITNLMLKLGH